MTESELQALGDQLSCPEGAMGIEVAKSMHETNISMTNSTLDWLDLQAEQTVLELGYGSAAHVPHLLSRAPQLHYQGLEVSKTMWQEAQKEASAQAAFQLYNGTQLPFKEGVFDRIFTVNTIYFWEKPYQLLQELARTLKADGCCILTYAEKAFMQTLPFVREQFRLVDQTTLLPMLEGTGLQAIAFNTQTEQVQSKTGELLERTFTMVKLKK